MMRYFLGKVGKPLVTFEEVDEVEYIAARVTARFASGFSERKHSNGSSFSDGKAVQGIERSDGGGVR